MSEGAPPTPPLARIRAALASRGVRPTRKYGQNFLTDPGLLERIVDDAGVGDGDEAEVHCVARLELGGGEGPDVGAIAAALHRGSDLGRVRRIMGIAGQPAIAVLNMRPQKQAVRR